MWPPTTNPGRPSAVSKSSIPPGDTLSALPPPVARVGAFVAIVAAGLAGGVIGYSLVRIQCSGDCGLALGVGSFVGAVAAAGGVAVAAVLVLRALGEWYQLRDRIPRR